MLTQKINPEIEDVSLAHLLAARMVSTGNLWSCISNNLIMLRLGFAGKDRDQYVYSYEYCLECRKVSCRNTHNFVTAICENCTGGTKFEKWTADSWSRKLNSLEPEDVAKIIGVVICHAKYLRRPPDRTSLIREENSKDRSECRAEYQQLTNSVVQVSEGLEVSRLNSSLGGKSNDAKNKTRREYASATVSSEAKNFLQNLKRRGVIK